MRALYLRGYGWLLSGDQRGGIDFLGYVGCWALAGRMGSFLGGIGVGAVSSPSRFVEIFLIFTNFLSLKSFGNSSSNSYVRSCLLPLVKAKFVKRSKTLKILSRLLCVFPSCISKENCEPIYGNL